MDSNITSIIVLAGLVLFSAYFSATETAFSSLNKIKLKSMAAKGDKRAARTLVFSEKFDKILSTILIGNNIVNIAGRVNRDRFVYQMVRQRRRLAFHDCDDGYGIDFRRNHAEGHC